MISICIPCKDDIDSLSRTIDSVFKTATETFEIVVCDDGSKEPIKVDRVKVVRHKNTIGVGAAIDTAVKNSQFDIIAISGSDIVHKDDRWMTRLCADAILEPETIFCSTTLGYKPELEEDKRWASVYRHGARMILKADINDIPKARRFMYGDDWKMLYRSKWNKEPVEELSTLLGAFYVLKKDWYNHLRGFEMHRNWGTLDSYLAMKSWLAGGSCKLSDVITGHEFNMSTHRPMDWFFYNKVLVTRTLFPYKEKELLDWISDKRMLQVGIDMANSYIEEIGELSEYFRGIFMHDYDWYVNKFDLEKSI
jgi:glycosyltransferase involved in cell wall biosynthesis